MKHLAPLALLSTALLAASTAHADGPGFGARAHTVIVLDNLAGVMHETISADNSDGTGLTYGGTSPGIYSYGVITRFGVHQFLTDSISVGGAFHYSDRSPTLFLFRGATIIALAPRVGYVAPLSDSTAFWLRVGATYTLYSGDNDGGSVKDLAIGGEALFVYTPVEHFGITLGPMVEVGVYGKITQKIGFGTGPKTEISQDIKHSIFGLAFGFLFDL